MQAEGPAIAASLKQLSADERSVIKTLDQLVRSPSLPSTVEKIAGAYGN